MTVKLDGLMSLPCCNKGGEWIKYREYDFDDGPEEDGFCIGFHCAGGDVYYENIDCCPFCGTTIKKEKR
jgi:hypothetical protein